MSAIVSRWLTTPLNFAQVLLAGGDVLGQVGRAGALVPGDDNLRFQGGDGIQAGDPCFAAGFVGLGGHRASAILARAQRRDVRPNI